MTATSRQIRPTAPRSMPTARARSRRSSPSSSGSRKRVGRSAATPGATSPRHQAAPDRHQRHRALGGQEISSLVGPTQILFYPHGGRPDGDDWHQTGERFQYLQSQGFRIFASVGTSSFSYVKPDISAVICDRLHPDSTTAAPLARPLSAIL